MWGKFVLGLCVLLLIAFGFAFLRIEDDVIHQASPAVMNNPIDVPPQSSDTNKTASQSSLSDDPFAGLENHLPELERRIAKSCDNACNAGGISGTVQITGDRLEVDPPTYSTRRRGKFQFKRIDINEDGEFEYLMSIEDRDFCASAGCLTELYWRDGTRFRPIVWGHNIWFSKLKTNGFFDVVAGYKGPGFEFQGPFDLYKWNGSAYAPSGLVRIKANENSVWLAPDGKEYPYESSFVALPHQRAPRTGGLGAIISDSPTPRPSFDCSKASTPVEITICTNADLARLDGSVGQAYQEALRRSPSEQRKGLAEQQRRWIEKRNATCAADAQALRMVSCLTEAISTRTQELELAKSSAAVALQSTEEAESLSTRLQTDMKDCEEKASRDLAASYMLLITVSHSSPNSTESTVRPGEKFGLVPGTRVVEGIRDRSFTPYLGELKVRMTDAARREKMNWSTPGQLVRMLSAPRASFSDGIRLGFDQPGSVPTNQWSGIYPSPPVGDCYWVGVIVAN